MPGSTIPSLNTVSLIGTISVEARIDETAGKRSVTIGVMTQHGPGERTHRVVIQDEFLAQAVHARLMSGALIHVTGELDQDDDGVYVAVVNKRGSDIKVIGGELSTESLPRPHVAQTAPRPTPAPVTASVAERPAAPAEPARTTAATIQPAPAPRPAPQAPARSSLASLAAAAPSVDQDDGGDSGDEDETAEAEAVQPESPAAAPIHAPAATRPPVGMAARPTPSLPGAGLRPPPPRVPPSVGTRPAPVAQARPALPSGGPRPGMPNGAVRPSAPKPLGAVKDDDDIPF